MDASSPSRSRSLGMVVILLTVMLDAAGIGLASPVMPTFLRELTGEEDVSTRLGYFLSLYALMQFLFSPVLGALSDRYGRRPILLISLAGAATDYLIMAMAPNVHVLYIGRILAGITGASMAVATAYIADVSDEKERATQYGLMNACLGLGFVLGPLLGAWLIGYGPRLPFFVASLLNGLTFTIGFFALGESHRVGEQATKRSLNPLKSLRMVLDLPTIRPYLIVFFLMHFVGQMPHSLWVLYCQDRLAWSPSTVGYTFATFGVLYAISQAFLTGPATRLLGERYSLLFGILMEVCGYVLMGNAWHGSLVYAVIVILCLGSIAYPGLQSYLSRQVTEDQQGELQGALVSLISIAAIVGPWLFTNTYSHFRPTSPGMVWFIGAGLYILCLPVFLRWRHAPSQPTEPQQPATPIGPSNDAAAGTANVA